MKLNFSVLLLILNISCSTNPVSRSQVEEFRELPLSQQLSPFTTDGCSFFPEGTKKNKSKWIKCCILHDLKYWAGGSQGQKLLADKELKSCVSHKDANIIAKMMYQGVRIGGKPEYKTDFKWGYGWSFNRGYLVLTEKEQSYVNKLSPKKGEDLRKYIIKDKLDPEIDSLGPLKY